jgi:Trp operon repressor
MNEANPNPATLARIIASMRDADEVERFLRELLTPSERQAIEERWAIVRLLTDGLTQREVRDRLDVSIATVTRGSLQLQKGEGGFALALARARRLERAGASPSDTDAKPAPKGTQRARSAARSPATSPSKSTAKAAAKSALTKARRGKRP